MKDPYEVLGVRRGASKDEIRQAYRELVKKYHPDKFQSNPDMLKLAEEKMKEINEAYDYLMNHVDEAGYSSQTSASQEDKRIYAQVRQMIQRGSLYEAEDLLMKISDKSNPEWYFLNGVIYAQRGWYDKAYDYLRIAHETDPSNAEYAQSFETIKRAQRSGPVYTGTPQMGDDTTACLSCCATLACTDLCCHCLGGC